MVAPVPVKIRGGPDEYTLQNLTGRRLVDVAVIAPSDSGYRVGWLDELPTAAPEKTDEADDKDRKDAGKKKKDDSKKKKEDAKKTPEQKAQAVFDEAEAKDKEKKKAEEEALPPLPAEGDANVKARVDQVLNRPIVLNVDNAPRREAIALIAGQARIRYELDDKAIAKADINMAQAVTLRSPNIAPATPWPRCWAGPV